MKALFPLDVSLLQPGVQTTPECGRDERAPLERQPAGAQSQPLPTGETDRLKYIAFHLPGVESAP